MPNTQRTEEPSEEEGFGGFWYLFIQQILSASYTPGTENTAANTVDPIPATPPPCRETVEK